MWDIHSEVDNEINWAGHTAATTAVIASDAVALPFQFFRLKNRQKMNDSIQKQIFAILYFNVIVISFYMALMCCFAIL